VDVGVLRSLFRNLLAFKALYESDGVDTITGHDGESYNLWDLWSLYENLYEMLPYRMAQAIDLLLVQNMREREAQDIMRVARGNPVGKYATQGLMKLAVVIQSGGMPTRRTTGDGADASRSASDVGGRGGSSPEGEPCRGDLV
jgi:hypothetical protein